MNKIPQIKKTVSLFLSKEEGKISKEKLLKTGILLSASAIAMLKNANAACPPGTNSHNDHCNQLGNSYDGPTVIGTHGHSHGNHANHASHGSCCFPAGTMVFTPKGNKRIETIKVGEKVVSFNQKESAETESNVVKVESPLREEHYEIKTGKGHVLKITNEHPIFTKKNGTIFWAAINKEDAKKETPNLKKIEQLCVGDLIYHRKEGWLLIKEIKEIKGKIKTYNLSEIKDTHTFFADGFLVHNKGGW